MEDALLSAASERLPRATSFYDPESSSDEDWEDALEQPGITPADPVDVGAAARKSSIASTSQPGPSQDHLCKSSISEHASEQAVLGVPLDLRERPHTPGVPLKGPQLLHQRSDSAFSTAESSARASELRADTNLGSTSYQQSQQPASSLEQYPAHRAAFDGDDDMAIGLLLGLSEEQKCRLDPQGNTVLHVAVMRRRHALVERLLALGFQGSVRSARGWTAMDEATALADRRSVRMLHTADVAAVKAELKSKRGLLLQTMRDMPDYSFKLKWELGSPVFGPMLRRFAPNDTYQVWKQGTTLRVDGTLMGIEDKNAGLIPEWKRGHFSLLFDGAPKPATLLFLDHRKKRFFDLTAERKKQSGASTEAEVSDILMAGSGTKTKMKASEFRFKPVRGWLGGDQTETIEGWKTKVYEANGKLDSVTTHKGKLVVPEGASFEDYLSLTPDADRTEVQPVDLFSLGPGSKAAGPEMPSELAGSGKGMKAAKQPRKLSAKCWMAAKFPMSLKQLLPILDIVGHTNKHLARVGKFMRKYGDMELFPVKLQVPLLWTAYAQVSFRDFAALNLQSPAGRADWYQLPPDYTSRTLDDVAAQRQKKFQDSLVGDESEATSAGIFSDEIPSADERRQLKLLLEAEQTAAAGQQLSI